MFLVVLAFGQAALAQPAPEAAALGRSLPPPARPTALRAGLYLIALTRLSPPNEAFPTFHAELGLDARWRDPRLAWRDASAETERTYLGAQVDALAQRIWWPELELENLEGARQVESRELTIARDGSVEYIERFSATFSTRVDLRRFPFDQQTLLVHLESLPWNEGSLRLLPLDERSGFEHAQSSTEWRVLRARERIASRREIRSDTRFSRLSLEITVQRLPWFYLWKIALPLLLVVAMGWSSFWMTGEGAPTRLQRAFIATLSVVAFHQVVSQNLPRIAYLTFLDGVVYLAFGSAGLTVVQIIVTHHLGAERAARLDRACRVGFPLAFAAILVGLWVFFHR